MPVGDAGDGGARPKATVDAGAATHVACTNMAIVNNEDAYGEGLYNAVASSLAALGGSVVAHVQESRRSSHRRTPIRSRRSSRGVARLPRALHLRRRRAALPVGPRERAAARSERARFVVLRGRLGRSVRPGFPHQRPARSGQRVATATSPTVSTARAPTARRRRPSTTRSSSCTARAFPSRLARSPGSTCRTSTTRRSSSRSRSNRPAAPAIR